MAQRPPGRAGRGDPGRRRGRPRPTVRAAGVKVSHQAARSLTAGHPWVFRDSLLRPLVGKEAGELVAVHDEDGRPLGWGLVEPEGAIAVRMVSAAEQFAWTDEVLAQRVQAALDLRAATLLPGVATACRLVHGEGDGLPGLAVDRLGDFLLIYKYSRAAEAYLDLLVPVLDQAVSPAGIYMQDRVRGVVADERKPPAFHLRGKTAPPDVEVQEDGLTFLVDVSAPVSPGLFLDLREGRRLAERLSAGRRVLNLFSFTGSFGVRAVRGGATEVVNIDAAARSHARCRQNLSASGMDPEA
ncbi:MAG: class I SAM-dependent methyltransferase, partial [Myxococcota bacterium]